MRIFSSFAAAFGIFCSINGISIAEGDETTPWTDGVQPTQYFGETGAPQASFDWASVFDGGELSDWWEDAARPSDKPATLNASIGAVFLTRARRNTPVIIGNNPSTGVSYSRGNDFGFNTREGIDVVVAHRFANGDQIEGRYFGLESSEASHVFASPGPFIGAGFTGPGGTQFVGNYVSTLHSLELNWKHPLTERVTFLSGFRYVGFDDSLIYDLNSNVARGWYAYENDLYGGQVGADIALLDPERRLQFNVVTKAGLYGNHSNGGISEYQGLNYIGGFGRSDAGAAFVGDLQLVGSFRLTKHIALRAGYQMLWIDGVALAGDNAGSSQLNPALLRTTSDRGSVFYHGAMTGVEFQW